MNYEHYIWQLKNKLFADELSYLFMMHQSITSNAFV